MVVTRVLAVYDPGFVADPPVPPPPGRDPSLVFRGMDSLRVRVVKG